MSKYKVLNKFEFCETCPAQGTPECALPLKKDYRRAVVKRSLLEFAEGAASIGAAFSPGGLHGMGKNEALEAATQKVNDMEKDVFYCVELHKASSPK